MRTLKFQPLFCFLVGRAKWVSHILLKKLIILLEPSIEFSFCIHLLFLFSGFDEWYSFLTVVVKTHKFVSDLL